MVAYGEPVPGSPCVDDYAWLVHEPIHERVRATPWLAGTDVGGQTLGEVLDEQLRFSVAGSGKHSERALVPQNEAARRALDSRRLEQRLRGLIGVVDPVSAITEIRSISLSTSPAGAAVNALLSDIGRGRAPMPKPDSSPAERRAVLDTLDQWTSFFGGDPSSLASYGPADVVVGPALTHVLTAQRSDGETARDAVQVFVHEMQHRVSPVPDDVPDDPKAMSLRSYLEEGTADALATMRGVTPDAARRAGIRLAQGPMDSPRATPLT